MGAKQSASTIASCVWELAEFNVRLPFAGKLLESAAITLASDLWPLTSSHAYSTLTSLQRKRYLFVCINRRAEDNPKGCCAAKDSEEVYTALKGEVAARGLAKLEARVCTSSCLDQCATGVTVLVEPDHFFYGRVTAADVPEIVDGLINGEPVKRLVITADQHNGARWDERHGR